MDTFNVIYRDAMHGSIIGRHAVFGFCPNVPLHLRIAMSPVSGESNVFTHPSSRTGAWKIDVWSASGTVKFKSSVLALFSFASPFHKLVAGEMLMTLLPALLHGSLFPLCCF